VNVSKVGFAVGQGFMCLPGLESNLHIGDYVSIGINTKFYCFNVARIVKFCMLAGEVTISNGGHDTNSFVSYSSPLFIGNGCWIGSNVTICGAVQIGDNAIIGAGSVVIRDFPAGDIVAGVPAKTIGKRQLPDKVWHLGGGYIFLSQNL
jgi:acetyltransferase-like isoleucine patch superfamily enzyme